MNRLEDLERDALSMQNLFPRKYSTGKLSCVGIYAMLTPMVIIGSAVKINVTELIGDIYHEDFSMDRVLFKLSKAASLLNLDKQKHFFGIALSDP